MSGRRHLAPGPWSKSAAWRGGAFMLGGAVLALALDWLAGDLVEVGFGRLIVVMIIAGLTLSAPFGIGWFRGEHDRREARQTPPPLVPQRIEGPSGSTYVIVQGGPGGTVAGAPSGRSVRSRELGPGWFALYTLFWRWPVIAGDAVLSGLWSLIGQFSGFSPIQAEDGRHGADAEPKTAEQHGAPDQSF